MIVEEACWERGCACYDHRFDKGVEVVRKEWVGLTDEEIENLWGEPVDCMYSGHYNAIRDIEAKLKEKNGG